MKLFIGPWKSGSTSLGEALNILGFKGMGHHPALFSEREYGLINSANKVIQNYSSLRETPLNIIIFIKEKLKFVRECSIDFDFFDDFPLGHDGLDPFIRKILFVNAKFIYLERDSELWLNSVVKHDRVFFRQYNEPHTLWERGDFHDRFLLEEKKINKKRYILLNEEFNQDVLFMDVKNGWDPLCAFLKCARPDVIFPHVNKTLL